MTTAWVGLRLKRIVVASLTVLLPFPPRGDCARRRRDLEVRGLADLRRARHGRGGLSHAAADLRASVSLGRCDVPQGAGRRPRRQSDHGRGRGRHHQRRSPSARDRRRPVGGPGVLDRLSLQFGETGLSGVRLVIPDAHDGLKQAISTVLSGTSWQRCHVHFMRKTLPQGAREAIAAIVRTIFAQPNDASAMTQLRKVADGLHPRFPQAATVLEEAADDILAYRHLRSSISGSSTAGIRWSA